VILTLLYPQETRAKKLKLYIHSTNRMQQQQQQQQIRTLSSSPVADNDHGELTGVTDVHTPSQHVLVTYNIEVDVKSTSPYVAIVYFPSTKCRDRIVRYVLSVEPHQSSHGAYKIESVGAVEPTKVQGYTPAHAWYSLTKLIPKRSILDDELIIPIALANKSFGQDE
jgi:hypothetical protein